MMTQMKKSECRRIMREYIECYDPYEKKPALGYNIAEMSRYARKNNRKISELTQEEAAMFAIKKMGGQ